MAISWSLTIGCAHPARLAIWAGALEYVKSPPPARFGSWEEWFTHFGVPEHEWDEGASLSDPDGIGPNLSFLQVPEAKIVKNRLHLDFAGLGRPGYAVGGAVATPDRGG